MTCPPHILTFKNHRPGRSEAARLQRRRASRRLHHRRAQARQQHTRDSSNVALRLRLSVPKCRSVVSESRQDHSLREPKCVARRPHQGYVLNSDGASSAPPPLSPRWSRESSQSTSRPLDPPHPHLQPSRVERFEAQQSSSISIESLFCLGLPSSHVARNS